MKRRYLAFDLETALNLPADGGDWRSHRPLGITCAATLSVDGETVLWHARTGRGEYAPRMDRSQAVELATHLYQSYKAGWTLLTWNGLGFDFDILAEESGLHTECREMALNHVDMMFHFFCLQGYPLALDTASRGMGLQGKTAGMSGRMAPELWAGGEYQRVLDYLGQDVRATLALGLAVENAGSLRWISRSGKPAAAAIGGWRTVAEALRLPEPDTSWMSKPLSRWQFLKWTEVVL
jgi:hypothetical protein